MQLAFALLADLAEITSEGKIAMLGGDIDTIKTQMFPAVHPRLSLVVKLNVKPAECNREHQFQVEVLNPAGELITPEIKSAFIPRPGEDKDRPLKYIFVLSFPLLLLSTSGTYIFRLLVNDEELGTLPLYVVESDTSSRSAAAERQDQQPGEGG
jgi:hypothetical protein